MKTSQRRLMIQILVSIPVVESPMERNLGWERTGGRGSNKEKKVVNPKKLQKMKQFFFVSLVSLV